MNGINISIVVAFATAILTSHANLTGNENKRLEIERNFEYSDVYQCYTKSPEGQENIINQLVAAHSIPAIDKIKVRDALQIAIARNCDINELDRAGLTPLAAAVLFNDAEMVEFLLKHDANLHAQIQRPNSPVDKMTVPQFLTYLLERETQYELSVNRTQVYALIVAAEKVALATEEKTTH